MRYRRFSLHACAGFVALLSALTAGCTSAKYEIVPVEGKIAFADGNPLPAGTRLILNPAEGGMGTAEAETHADGTFAVTHVSGSRGAEIGNYTVVLAAPKDDQGEFYQAIPKEYYDGGVLSAEVKKDMPPLDLRVNLHSANRRR